MSVPLSHVLRPRAPVPSSWLPRMSSVLFPWTPKSVTGTAGETLSREKDQTESVFLALRPLHKHGVGIVFANFFILKCNIQQKKAQIASVQPSACSLLKKGVIDMERESQTNPVVLK